MTTTDTRNHGVSNPTDTRWARKTLQQACAAAGYRAADAELIKFTNNAVFALKHDPVVVRIAGSESVRSRVNTVVNVARWLTRTETPAVELIEDQPQPMPVNGTLVTFWHRVEATESTPSPDGRDLGAILRDFHALPAPEFNLPHWNPLLSIRRRLNSQDVLAAADLRFAQDLCDQLEESLDKLTFDLPPGVIHGDPFVGNLIASQRGAVICDFDSVSIGPREWDLTPIAVGSIRFDYPINYHSQLRTEYGYDITGWPHFPVFQRLREFQLVTSVLPTLQANPALRDQWQHRFTTFRDGDHTAKWTTYR
ncbi:aminoglycoside phosphotransferase family protein [Nocardia cyriacigeorgica]|uniref:aminoglycoside phosphotransferase family protein n=1 Tax=Nocardia cyriacigeorgica TaxID=135487 RepID=UPI002492C4B1|nr:aminoglycoside phosphotransferase family protein [Nocardia cyriacigeorgica]BDU04502.1 aminoglycoside phosphotransferase [Nocardia cyriacigeorgica]